MTNADAENMGEIMDMQTVLSIKDAHISELRHALTHVASCSHNCDDCKRIARMAVKHETWWEHIDTDAPQKAQDIAHSAEECWHQHQT
jgi:hypothetical protein